MSVQVSLTVNGVERSAAVEERRTLADFLREELGLTGTHLGCEHGICGSCTVIVDGVSARISAIGSPTWRTRSDASTVKTGRATFGTSGRVESGWATPSRSAAVMTATTPSRPRAASASTPVSRPCGMLERRKTPWSILGRRMSSM